MMMISEAWVERIARRVLRVAATRKPDMLIGGDADPYMRRWYLVPRNPILNVYLHHFRRDDDDRALHDHPWDSISIQLSGVLIEYSERETRLGFAGTVRFRTAAFAHRLAIPGGSPAPWTLFITGPRRRRWGFLCPQGWRPWQEFVDARDPGAVGRGCE